MTAKNTGIKSADELKAGRYADNVAETLLSLTFEEAQSQTCTTERVENKALKFFEELTEAEQNAAIVAAYMLLMNKEIKDNSIGNIKSLTREEHACLHGKGTKKGESSKWII